MNFIKKIFDGEIDEKVHLQFQKFSRGEFLDRAVIIAKKAANGNYSINTSPEFGNEFVEMMAKKLGSDSANVKGAIVTTRDLDGELEFKDKKQFQGVKRYIIDRKMTGDEILKLLDENIKSFFGLSFNTPDGSQLKIKPKAPKSGKPGKGDEKPKADFCKLKTTDEEIAKDFVFEKPNFKQAEIKHEFIIEKIVIPEELKDSKDFAKIREESKRQGKIIRKATVDEEVVEEEKEFAA